MAHPPGFEHPQLSVVVACYRSGNLVDRCIESLLNQTADTPFEILVVESSGDGTAERLEERFPSVRVVPCAERKFPGSARNLALPLARGPIVAFIDADCVAAPTWVAEILKAHESPHLAIGGAIANAEPCGLVAWAAYFTEFSRWMPAGPGCWLPEVPTANVSYKRTVFEQVGLFLEGTYCSDSEFHWRLGRLGHRVRFVPSILIHHRCIGSFRRLLAHEFHHGRSFAQVRMRGQRFSGLRRLIYAAFAFLLPAKLSLGVIVRNLRNRVYLPRFLAALPLVLLGITAWSLGEWAGYLRGGGPR